MFKVIIAGSRIFDSFADYIFLEEKCDNILSSIEDEIQIVSGKAPGADTLGEEYAKKRGYDIKPFPAPWKEIKGKPKHEIKINSKGEKYWTKAGHIRNKKMAEYADALILFNKGTSGSRSMLRYAKDKKLKIRHIKC